MHKKAEYSSKACLACGQAFRPTNSSMRFCSLPCRFWNHVDQSGSDDCWQWMKAISPTGYGNFTAMPGSQEATHRMAYKLTCGEIPKGKYVCHRCDNRKCCNPSHLYLGSPKDNTRDMWNKKRQHSYTTMQRGSARHNAKLDRQKVMYIRRSFSSRSASELAAEMGVHASTVIKAAIGKTWAHLPAPYSKQVGARAVELSEIMRTGGHE